MSISNKIDFAVILTVKNANPNGDPLNGNRPRTTIDGLGEISDVCLKRKIRNKLMDLGANIFVQSDDRRKDDFKTLRDRAEHILPKKKGTPPEEVAQNACNEWYDVRAFGQVLAFKSSGNVDGVSVGIRGPISIHPAFSVDPVNVTSSQITKSVSNEGDGTKKSSDTMGMKHRVDSGVYVFFGAISPQLAFKTGFSDDDANLFKKALVRLFEGDASSARPEGSMEVSKIFWWAHNCPDGQYSSAKVHHSLTVNPDGSYELKDLPGLTPEIIEGF
jgi:CRISPR-associated protein Csd2